MHPFNYFIFSMDVFAKNYNADGQINELYLPYAGALWEKGKITELYLP